METHKRVFFNTLAQYIKAIINTCLSLYTVRLILSALGQSDYGIYSLIAGTIAMLGFVINALVITTQRHLSYSQGGCDVSLPRKYFSNSLLLHIIVGIAIALTLLLFQDYLCSVFFNIPANRRYAASIVYIVMLTIMTLSFLSSPFKAAIIAHENIIYISVIEVLDGVLKLLLAVALLQLQTDKLVVYTIILLFIYLFELLSYALYTLKKYEECTLRKITTDFDWIIIYEIVGFAKWTTYGMGVVVTRTQGLSILLNKFFGTLTNASYGIALQLYGAVSFVSSSVINAMNPILMKSEGANDHQRMLRLAEKECIYVESMMAILFIPLIVELEALLGIWLKEVPTHTAFLCRCLLISFLIDQCTYGLNSANQAMGNIKRYTVVMYTPKLAYLPLAYLFLKKDMGIAAIMYLFIGIELFVALLRIPYLRYSANLNIGRFLKNVFGRVCPLIVFMCIVTQTLHMMDYPFAFLPNLVLSFISGSIFIWLYVFGNDERHHIRNILKK